MAKLPWMPWYTTDWLNKRSLRRCERGTRSDWHDMLNVMWEEQTATLKGTVAQLARMIGVAPDEMAATIVELYTHNVATIAPAPAEVVEATHEFSVTSRRMARDLKARAGNAERQRRHRGSKQLSLDDDPSNGYSYRQGHDGSHETRNGSDNEKPSDLLSERGSGEEGTDWNAAMFRELWERITAKSGMVRGELLLEAVDRLRDAARVAGVPVREHAQRLIEAFPKLIAWYKAQGMAQPVLGIAAFLDDKHFSRCDDVARGRLDLDEPGAKPSQQKARGQLPVARVDYGGGGG